MFQIDMDLLMPMWSIWLIIAVALVIIEIFTSSGIALCMALGAMAGFVGALCGGGIEVQLIICAVAMVGTLLFVPKLMQRYNRLFSPQSDGASNMDALIGRRGRVESVESDGSCGRMKIDGDRWGVRTADGQPLAENQLVEVAGYDSIILIVRPVGK